MPTDLDLLTRLTVALDGLAAALETGDPDAVLAAEAPIGIAAGALRQANLHRLASEPDVRYAMLGVRLAVARCRTLGHAASRLTAIVSSNGYGPSGRHTLQPASTSTVTART